jgi:hypothetical protein
LKFLFSSLNGVSIPVCPGYIMNRLLPALFLFCIALAPTEAKRKMPEKVAPAIHEGVRYDAPNKDGRSAIVRASDASTGKQLWEKEIFHITLKPDLEEDVQWVFIRRLSIQQRNLLIAAENGHSYALNLDTQEVTILN